MRGGAGPRWPLTAPLRSRSRRSRCRQSRPPLLGHPAQHVLRAPWPEPRPPRTKPCRRRGRGGAATS